MTVVIKGASAIGNQPVWIFADKIVAITRNTFGGAVLHLTDGHQYALKEKVEEVLKTLSMDPQLKMEPTL